MISVDAFALFMMEISELRGLHQFTRETDKRETWMVSDCFVCFSGDDSGVIQVITAEKDLARCR
jgi:hypothetical protein